MAKKKTTKTKPDSGQLTFEDAASRLDQIVDRLETGNLNLDESLSTYEEGIHLLKQCNRLLETAEQKIELLMSVDSSGNVRTEPFDDSATEMDESGRARSKKRSANSTEPDSTGLF